MSDVPSYHDPVLGEIIGYASAEEFNAAVAKWNAEHADEDPMAEDRAKMGDDW